MKIHSILCLTLATTLLAACASDKEPEGGIVKEAFPATKKAPKDVGESLQPVNAGSDFTGTEGSSIRLKKASLGKTFLMSMTLSTGDNAARRSVLLPKVVKFESNGSELALTEENYNSIYKEIPTGKLLQTFKIESQDDNTITFRWNYGLATIPTKGFYVVSDSPESVKEGVDAAESVLPVTSSFLKSAQIRNNRLELRQLSAVSNLEALLDDKTKKIATGAKAVSVQLDIAITPYVKNERFKARLSTKQEGVGFFETARVRENEGPIDIYASRWDFSKEAGPVTYKISSKAPPEAVEAMKEGVLYWNSVIKTALGRSDDVIKVETNADPNEPLQHRSVIVHWVPYATAGSAYANFQPDPLTGEITSGLVYQTSVFFLSGKQRGRRFVNRGVENRARELTPAGFRSAEICDFKDPVLRDPQLNEGLDEKMSLKFANDYLRHVVAHEVGHTLGLRHNFAGSLASKMPTPADNRDKFKEYLNDHNHPGAEPSSSVMEYSTFRDSLLEGASLRTATLPYDLAAIKWGYGEDYVKPENIQAPLFCTDVEGGGAKTFGCSTDDTGPAPIKGHAAGVARNKSLAADIIIEALIDAIRPENENDTVSVAKALANNHPDKLSAAIGVELPHFLRLGGAGIKHIVVDRKLKGASWANQEAYTAATAEEIAKEFNDPVAGAGGLPGILKVAYDLDDGFKAKKGWLKEAVLARTANNPEFGRGKNLGGKPYQLTDQEKADVKAAAERLADLVEAALLRDMLLAVTGFTPAEVHGGAGKLTPAVLVGYPEGLKTWAPYVAIDSWQAGLAALAEQLANEAEGEVEGTVDGNAVKVPAPKFALEARMAAMRLYSGKVFGARAPEAWMKDQEAALATALIARLSPVVKVDPSNVDKVEPAGKVISKELLEWAKKEHAVLKALKAARK